MSSQPLVSIIIDNYNYGRFLKEAIESCLKQDYSPLEIIVVDDGSTDDSRQIITSFGDKIVPVLKSNGGQASAFNAGFAKSRGELICLLDSDDIFMPKKVSKVVQAFQDQPQAGWCFHAVECIGDYLWQAETSTAWLKNAEKESWLVDLTVCDDFGKMANKMPFIPPTSANIYSRSLLAKILPIPEDVSICSIDYYIHLAAFHLAKGILMKEPLTRYRIHGQNYTFSSTLKSRGLNYIWFSYWLHKKYPSHNKLWDRLFMQGLALSLAFLSMSRKHFGIFRKYHKEFGLRVGPVFWLKILRRIVHSYNYGLKSYWKNKILKK